MIYSGHGQRELLCHSVLVSQPSTYRHPNVIHLNQHHHLQQHLFASRLSKVILTLPQMNETPNVRMRVAHTSLEGDNISSNIVILHQYPELPNKSKIVKYMHLSV